MAVTTTGTPYEGTAAKTVGPKSLTNVTIPADATTALIAFAYFENSTTPNTNSVTLDGQSGVEIAELDQVNGNNNLAVWRVSGFSAGTNKTLAWNNGAAVNDGVDVGIIFLKGEDTADPVRDFDAVEGNSGTNVTVTTATLTAQTGDLMVSFVAADDTRTTTYGAGQTEILGPVNAGAFAELTGTTEAPTESGTQSATGDFPSIISVVIKPSAGGGAEFQSAWARNSNVVIV